jgi:PKD repeat protein
MGGMDLRRGTRSLGIVAAALGLAAATALAVPPQGDFTIAPNPPNEDEPTVFTCQPCPESTSVAWDLTGNSNFERSGTTVTVTFTSAQTRTMRMRLTRDEEVTIVSKTVTVNGRPTVEFDFDPESPLAGENVAFTSEVDDPEDNPVSVAWDFGDGTTATGQAAQHAYAEAGTFEVSATATDSHGADRTATAEIVVRDDPGPTSFFEFSPAVPDTGETVTFTSTSEPSQGSIVALDWDLDGDGAFDDFSGATAQWAFDSPGEHDVRLRTEQSNGESAVGEVTLRVNGLPSADFTWSPASPSAGDSVDLVSTSSDFEGPLAALSWDLDGDGQYGDGSEPQIRQPFPEPGTYEIGLQVTDSDGKVSSVRKQVAVLAQQPSGEGTTPAPPDGATPPAPEQPAVLPGGTTAPSGVAPRLRVMSPFPVVRIAGTVLRRGALISILSVRAPRGSRLRVRCEGRGCPVRSVATTAVTRLVRFRKFERRLRAGIRLKLFVRQAGRIGKYTSFLIRAGAAPKRTDLCLFPGRARPSRCP